MATKSVAVAVFLVGFVLFSKVAEPASSPAAPAPVPECSELILNLADCLSFVTNSSTEKKPKGKCCDGLKTVLQTNAFCLCEAFNSSAQLGISINTTKALTLPSACHLSAPSITNCNLGPASAPAPAVSPAAPSPSSTAAPTNIVPVPGTTNGSVPAASSGTSSSSAVAFAVGLLLVAMSVSLF